MAHTSPTPTCGASSSRSESVITARAAAIPSLEVLFESPDLSDGGLHGRLRAAYGGDVALPASLVYANFVASIDGVAAERTRPRSSKDISKGDAGDRFVMGLLRAAADVVVIGAGTLRAHTSGAWTPARAFPAASDQFSALRVEWELPASPRLAIVSATGHLPDHPSLDGAMMFTTSGGFRRLSSHAARFADVFVLPDGPAGVDLRRVVDILRAQGLDRILTEGGPGLMSALLRARVVDQLFLTLSPVVAGRDPGSDRPGIVDGLAFDPACFRQARLLSLRRGGSFVFLRYELETSIGEREAS